MKLKIWPDDLEEIRTGRKRAEVRRCDDRKFLAGEELELEGFDPTTNLYVGAAIRVRVTHVERMAGPLMICGVGGSMTAVPLVVLSLEVL
jgi:hypothetical protein